MDRFRFVNVVWGADFTYTFLKVCLPSQLTPDNLPYLAKHTESLYRIYTTAKDANVIQKSSAYRDLSDIMPVEIATISGISYIGKYRAMTQCHAHFIRSGKDEDCAFIFVCPDVVWADGACKRLFEVFKSGKRMIMIFTPRLVKETFVPVFLEQYGEKDFVKPVSSRQMVKMAMDHLHPEMMAMTWNSEFSPGVSYGGMLWKVNRGLLIRQFHLFPLMVRPEDKDAVPSISVDADYCSKACPDSEGIYVVHDSDDICLVDITSMHEQCDFAMPNADRINGVAGWAKHNTNAMNREFTRHKIRFHWDECTEVWRETEESSDKKVEAILSLIKQNGDTIESPTESSSLSKIRYCSPRFIIGKLREKGASEFIKIVYFRLLNAFLSKVYGDSIRIKLFTASQFDSIRK